MPSSLSLLPRRRHAPTQLGSRGRPCSDATCPDPTCQVILLPELEPEAPVTVPTCDPVLEPDAAVTGPSYDPEMQRVHYGSNEYRACLHCTKGFLHPYLLPLKGPRIPFPSPYHMELDRDNIDAASWRSQS